MENTDTTSVTAGKKPTGFTAKLKAWGSKLLAITISVLVALLIGEGIVRLMFKKQMVLFPRYHTDANYGDFKIRKIRPNASFSHTSYDGSFDFRTNSNGFQNERDIPYQKAPGELRVLVLGDSHTQGYEVNYDQTFSYVAEKSLTQHQVKATVINAGVSGFSTAEELIMLENEGYKYEPDYVVLGFYANDFDDNLRTRLFDLVNDSLVVANHEYTPGVKIQNKMNSCWVFRFLGEHSYLYGYAFNTAWDFYRKAANRNSKITETEYAIASKEKTSEHAKKLMAQLVKRMNDYCQDKGMKLIIVDIPNSKPESSIPSDMMETFKNNSDTLFSYNDLAGEYSRLKLTHVSHGHRHISAETHNLIANKITEYILSDRKL